MKLKTLLLLSFSMLILTLILTVFIFNTKMMQHYIENQVYSSTQDTAYSLGLALSSIGGDAPLTEKQLMINAIFDSGYYEYIKLYDANGKLITQKEQPLIIKDVPQWFINLVPLHISVANSDISLGWSMSGKISVKGHPGFAYYELWENFKSFALFFALISIVSLLLIFIMVHFLLKSLTAIKNQANAIDKHLFILEDNHSFICEFKLLTHTMNHIVKKVEAIYNSEVKTFQMYQNLNYKDQETNLPNKKYLLLKLHEMYDSEDTKLKEMYIAMLQIDGLNKFKTEHNYLLYKELLMSMIENIQNTIDSKGIVVRMSENELAILFDTAVNVEQTLFNVHEKFKECLKKLKIENHDLYLSSGYTSILRNENSSKILSRVDYALQKSKMQGQVYSVNAQRNDFEIMLTNLGKDEWREKFEEILQNNQVIIAQQQCIEIEGDGVFHDEALLRILEKDGSVLSGGIYLPMINALGMIQKFDKSVLDITLSLLSKDKTSKAVNIGKECVTSNSSFQRFREQLIAIKRQYAHRLHIECQENDIVNNLDIYIDFSKMIEEQGQSFGIDRFSGLENIEYIKKLRPSYIKIASSVLLELHKKDYGMIHSLEILCEVMDIKIIATAVQSKQQVEELKSLEYKYFQGDYFAEPKLLESLSGK